MSGDAALTLAADGTNVEFTGLKVVDASAMTAGGLTIDLSGNATNTTSLAFTGSAGNDTLTLAQANFSTKAAINGGAGNDVLGISAVDNTADSTVISSANGAKISGFEALRVSTAGALADGVDVTVDASAVAGIKDIQIQAVAGTATKATTLNVTNLPIDGTVTFLGSQTADITNAITFRAADLGLADRAANVTLGDAAGVDGTKNGVTINSLSVDQATVLNLDSVGGANTITTLSADAVKSIDIDGDKQVTFSLAGLDGVGGGNDGALATIDASGLVVKNATDAGLTLTAATADAAAGGLTVTGTNGVDTLFGTSEAGNKNVFTGGAGADTINHQAGVIDQSVFRLGDSGTTIATADTINNFDVTADTLKFVGVSSVGTFSVGAGAFAGNGNASAYVDGNNDLQLDFNGDGQIDMLIVGTFTGITSGNFLFEA